MAIINSTRNEIEDIVIQASGGEVTLENLRKSEGNLLLSGFSSLSLVNLVEMLEQRFGMQFNPERDSENIMTVDGIESMLLGRG